MRVFSPPFDALTPSRIPYSAEDLNLIARTIVENPDLPPKGYQIAEFLAQRNARHSKHSYQTFISGNWPTLRNKAKEMEHANRRAQARAQAEGEQADSLGSQPVGRQRQLIQEEGPSQAESLEEGELREDRESITFSRPTLPSNSAAANIRRPLPSQGPPIGSTRFRPPVAAAGRGRSPVPPMRRSKSPAQPRRRSRSPQILARRTTPPAPLFGGDAEDEEVDAALTPAVPATGVARAAARTGSGRSTAMRTTSGASKSDYESAAEDVSADAALGEAVPFRPLDEEDEFGGGADLSNLDDAEPIGDVSNAGTAGEAADLLGEGKATDDDMLDISKEADQGEEQNEADVETARPESVICGNPRR